MKKIFSTLLALVACVSLSFAASGTCGTNLKWDLDGNTLTISKIDANDADGAMSNFASNANAPWYANRGSIHHVVLETGVTSIGDFAFTFYGRVESVTMPSVTSIGKNAFQNCALTSLNIPSSLSSIGEKAFQNNAALTAVVLPSTVTSIGQYAFAGCTALSDVSIDCPVADYAFYGCSSLETVTLGTGVTSIGARGFSDCSALKFIELPSTLTYIGTAAFKGCSEFIRVICNATNPPDLAGSIFADVCPNYSIFVPAGTKNTYTTAPSKWRGVGFDGHVFDHPYAYTFEDAINQDYAITLETLNDGSVIDITLSGRTFLRNGDYNTICLPFGLSAEQLADPENPLYNFLFFEIYDMYEAGSFLKFKVNQVSSVVAGKPYLMKYNGEADNLSNPTFKYVTVSASEGDKTEVDGKVAMKGILKPTELEANNQNMLFLLAGNQLAWAAEGAGNNIMKGFRAYFEILSSPSTAPGLRRLMPSIVEQEETPTAIEIVENEETATKVIENGTMYIIKNGVKYNVQGQVISK